MQKNLFGIVTAQPIKAEKPKAKAKAPFPDLSLLKGLNEQEASADAVFWHRILLNKAIRQQKPTQFLQILATQ